MKKGISLSDAFDPHRLVTLQKPRLVQRHRQTFPAQMPAPGIIILKKIFFCQIDHQKTEIIVGNYTALLLV